MRMIILQSIFVPLVALAVSGAGYWYLHSKNVMVSSAQRQLASAAATNATDTDPGVVALSPDSKQTPGFAQPTEQQSATVPAGTPLASPRVPPAGSLEYRNTHYHFAFFYPDSYKMKTYDEGNGATTVTVIDGTDSDGTGFQIFVSPYGQRQVSAAVFKADEPSGVIKDRTNIIIAGDTQATKFFGENSIMGNTSEVWFVKNGYLYEVTTYKEYDAWLSQIMQTWRFI
jgi:hypothetical protein